MSKPCDRSCLRHLSLLILPSLLACSQPIPPDGAPPPGGPAGVPATGVATTNDSNFAQLTPSSPQPGYISLATTDGTIVSIGDAAGATRNSYSVVGAIQPKEQGAATWYDSVSGALFHGTRRDQVRVTGWNLAGNGTRIDPTDAAIGDQWESYYEEDSTNTWLERHWIYIDANGNYFRPLSCQMGRTSDWTNCYVAADIFAIVDRNAGQGKGVEYFRFATQTSPGSGYLAVNNHAVIAAVENDYRWLLQTNAEGTTNLSIAYIDSNDQVEVGVGSGTGGDAKGVVIGGNSSANIVRGTLTVPHLIGGGTTPSCVLTAAAGAPASCEIHGSDTAGTIIISTGAGTRAGPVASITYAQPYETPPYVVLGPASATASVQMPYVDGAASRTNSFVVASAAPLSAPNTFRFNYIISQ